MSKELKAETIKRYEEFYGDYVYSGLSKEEFAKKRGFDKAHLTRVINTVEKMGNSYTIIGAIKDALITDDNPPSDFFMLSAYRKSPKSIDDFIQKITGYSFYSFVRYELNSDLIHEDERKLAIEEQENEKRIFGGSEDEANT